MDYDALSTILMTPQRSVSEMSLKCVSAKYEEESDKSSPSSYYKSLEHSCSDYFILHKPLHIFLQISQLNPASLPKQRQSRYY